MQKVRFCVFGAGRMGARHIANIAAHPEIQLAYIVDPDLGRAAALSEQYGAKATGEPADALGDPSVGAAVIASATDTHVDLMIAAAQAGKAILCEKPIDLDMARVEACAEAIKDCNVPIMIGFQRRFDATHAAVKRAVESGEVGRTEVISIVSRDPSPPPLSYILTSGGQFHDQMIHDFDLALWLSGASGRVDLMAMASALVDPEIGNAGDTDTAQVLMKFEDGSLCKIDCSRRASYGYDQRVEVFGAKGLVSSANLAQSGLEVTNSVGTMRRDLLLQDFMARYLPTYAAELDAFASALFSNEPPTPSFADGRRALQLADAARRSHKSNAPVSIVLS